MQIWHLSRLRDSGAFKYAHNFSEDITIKEKILILLKSFNEKFSGQNLNIFAKSAVGRRTYGGKVEEEIGRLLPSARDS